MMKNKLIGFVLLVLSGCSLFAYESFDSDAISETEITFNKKTYSLAYNREFNDDVIPLEYFSNSQPVPPGDRALFYDRDKNSIGMLNSPSNFYVKDGVCHMIEQHYVDEKGVYHQDFSRLRGVNLWCDLKKIENPQYFGEGYYEFRFKMPYVKGMSLAIFLYSAEEHKDLTIGHENEKGYAWNEVDFCEIKPLDGGKCIEPLGGFHVSNIKTGKKVSSGWDFNEDTWHKTIKTSKEWFDEWHTFQVVWEKNTMKIYYDGVLFKTVSIPKYLGSAQGKYGLFIDPEYCDYDWEENPARNKVDWSDESKHDFQLDYVRYYVPKQ